MSEPYFSIVIPTYKRLPMLLRVLDALDAQVDAPEREVIVIAHGHPLTARLLREYLPRWEARGIRLVPVSHLAK